MWNGYEPDGAADRQGTTDRRTAIRWMLRDLQALQLMLRDDRFETGIRRIGAEQEMFLVDASWQPAPGALRLLAALAGHPYTTEVGAFNLELNLDPAGVRRRLPHPHARPARRAARPRAGRRRGRRAADRAVPARCRRSASATSRWTTWSRTRATSRSTTRSPGLRGEDYELHIKGTDELRVRQDSVMAEACNASFQVHLQVTPDEFANAYNFAQALTGPTLASATNSPLLFGKRLWAETRIALFEQAVDTRRPGHHVRERTARVSFGDAWVTASIADLYKEDITRFRPLLAPDDYVDPIAELDAGRVPELAALRLHTGTVWRWNRACYGISQTPDGEVPHLRIENRVLPSGPSTTDEIANAALWIGLMRVGARAIPGDQPVDAVRAGAVELRRRGAPGPLVVAGLARRPGVAGRRAHPRRAAAAGPRGSRVAGRRAADIDRYLGVIERRVRSGYTGSRWVLSSLSSMHNQGSSGQRLNSLTAAMVARQRGGTPVAEWAPASLDEGGQWQHNFVTVEQLMTTDLVTVAPDDPVELVANLLDWHRIRQVLVEESDGTFVGLVSYRAILRLLAAGGDCERRRRRRDEARTDLRPARPGAAAGPGADAPVRDRRPARS